MNAKIALFVMMLTLVTNASYAVESKMDRHQMIHETSDEKVILQNDQKIEQKFDTTGRSMDMKMKVDETTMRRDFRQDFASREAQFNERIDQMKALFQKRRDEFKEKIDTFKDENKKAVAENVDILLQNANTTRTNVQSQALERLTGVLQGLQTKVDAAKSEGTDTTAAQTKIDTASKAIADAQAAVATQAGSTYTATVSSESTVKTSMSTTSKQLRTDLKKVQDAVQSARRAVIDAARATYQLQKTQNGTPATSSAAL